MTDVVADRVVVEYQVMAQPYLRAMADLEARSQKTYGSVLSGGARMEQGLRSSLLSSAAAADMLGRSLGMVTAALGTREVMRYADAWTAAGNKITAMGTPLDEQQRRLQQLADVAVDTRANFEATVQTFARLEMSTKGLGKSQTELLRITETINKAFAVGGAAPSEQFAASLQLSQALSSGILGGDELRSVRENAPVIARAIADVMGTTVGNLKNLGEQGQLTSAVVIEALERLGPEVDKAFGQTVPTIGQALENLKTRLTEFVGTASQTSGAGQVISGSINLIAQNFDKLADAAIVVGAVFAGRYASGLASAAGAEAQLLAAHANGTAVLINSAEASRQRAAAALNEANAIRVSTTAKADQAAVNAAALRIDLEMLSAERAAAMQAMATLAPWRDKSKFTAQLIEIRQSELALDRQLTAAEMTLAEARAAEIVATTRAATAQEAYGIAAAATTLRVQALAAGSKLLQTTLSFFGGPIGLAITGLSVAMIALAGSTDKVAEATDRAKEAGDGFWKVVDRATLKIREQNAELVKNRRLLLETSIEGSKNAIQGGLSEMSGGLFSSIARPFKPFSNPTDADFKAARQLKDYIEQFKSAGDYSSDAVTRLYNKILEVKKAAPDLRDTFQDQAKVLLDAARTREVDTAKLAVLNGKATPLDVRTIREAEGETESGVYASPAGSGSSRSDAFTKAVEAAKERTASLQMESQVAGKSVYEQEKAKAALELRTAADKDLAKAQEKRAQITSKSTAATKQADAELAAANTLHDQRIRQVDALADALARQASAADKAKKAASTDHRENSNSAKQSRIAAANDVDTLLAEANRDLTKVQTDAAVRAAATFDAYTKARVKQVIADAAAQVEVIEAKGKEELAKLDKLKPGWSGYQDAVDKVNGATAARKDAVNAKAQSEIADEFVASTIRETQAMRDDMETIGLTREEADRFLNTKRLLAVASTAEANGQADVAQKARTSAADYNAASEGLERVREANERAVEASDSLRDSVRQTIVNFKDAKSAAASFLGVLANSAASEAVEAIFGKRGTPIGGKSGGSQSTGGGILASAWGLARSVIPGFANGTNSAPAGLALVGERGPELVNLPGGAQVIPDVTSLANRVTAGVQNNALSYTNFGGNIVVTGDTDSRSLRLMKAMLDHSESQFDARWLAMSQKFNRNK
jgi:tape measure domain-containing protein